MVISADLQDNNFRGKGIDYTKIESAKFVNSRRRNVLKESAGGENLNPFLSLEPLLTSRDKCLSKEWPKIWTLGRLTAMTRTRGENKVMTSDRVDTWDRIKD